MLRLTASRLKVWRKRFPEDSRLDEFFTDAKEACAKFESLVIDPDSPRILVYYGEGLVGKSTILRKNRLYCHQTRIPVALAGLAQQADFVSLLQEWQQGLSQADIDLPHFNKTLKKYTRLKNDVTQKSADPEVAKMAGLSAGLLTKMVGGAVLSSAVQDASQSGAKVILDYLRAKMSESDWRLLAHPADLFIEAFAEDLHSLKLGRRLALLLDQYERVQPFERDISVLIRQLPISVLTNIAGKSLPEWGQHWPEWRGHAELLKIDPMEDGDIRTLVERYSLFVSHGSRRLESEEVDNIVRFAKGLPSAATMAVDLLPQGVCFRSVEPQVTRNIVRSLLNEIPDENWQQTFLCAAVLRSFNEETLYALRPATAGQKKDELYATLRRWPFIEERVEGWAMNDTIRELVDGELRRTRPAEYVQLHRQAGEFYKGLLDQSGRKDTDRLLMEWMYHSICEDERSGIDKFRQFAEQHAESWLRYPLQDVLGMVMSCRLEQERSRLWVKYYHARLKELSGHTLEAEADYRELVDSPGSDPQLRAYANFDTGSIIARDPARLASEGAALAAQAFLRRSLEVGGELDTRLIFAHAQLAQLHRNFGRIDLALKELHAQYSAFESRNYVVGMVSTLSDMKDTFGILGDWKNAYRSHSDGLHLLRRLPQSDFLKVRLGLTPWVYIWSGRLQEAAAAAHEAIGYFQKADLKQPAMIVQKDLALSLGMQDQYAKAEELFTRLNDEYFKPRREHRSRDYASFLGFWGSILLRCGELRRAEGLLLESYALKKDILDFVGLPEVTVWLGQLSQARSLLASGTERVRLLREADQFYRTTIDEDPVGRLYFRSIAMAGRARISYWLEDDQSFCHHFQASRGLAEAYEYNDVLACLHLLEGYAKSYKPMHDTPGFKLTSKPDQDGAVRSYYAALIYALRYNRYLLDRVLSGQACHDCEMGIAPACVAQPGFGTQILKKVRSLWLSGRNKLENDLTDTISPIPVDIPLVDAEETARVREIGDIKPQKEIRWQIDEALARADAASQ